MKARSAGADRRQLRFPSWAAPAGRVESASARGSRIGCWQRGDGSGGPCGDERAEGLQDLGVGRLTVPSELRQRWGLVEGGEVGFVDLGEAAMIVPGGVALARRRCDAFSMTGTRLAWRRSTIPTWPISLCRWRYVDVQRRTLGMCPRR